MVLGTFGRGSAKGEARSQRSCSEKMANESTRSGYREANPLPSVSIKYDISQNSSNHFLAGFVTPSMAYLKDVPRP